VEEADNKEATHGTQAICCSEHVMNPGSATIQKGGFRETKFPFDSIATGILQWLVCGTTVFLA
jgi:hypothetical protein